MVQAKCLPTSELGREGGRGGGALLIGQEVKRGAIRFCYVCCSEGRNRPCDQGYRVVA